MGRTLQVTHVGQTTSFEYDANGNVVKETNALGQVTRYEYDALNRRTKTLFSDGTYQTVSYNENGLVKSQTDAAGVTTSYAYDGLNRLLEVTDGLGGKTRWSYDEVGNKLTQTDAKGHTTRWNYDQAGRQVSQTLPLGMVERFEYGPTSALQKHTHFNGQVTTFEYDEDNRPVKICSAGEECEIYHYDEMGYRRQVTNAWGSVSYRYDDQHRLASKTLSNQVVLEYRYDHLGNRTQRSVTFPHGERQEVEYEYDALGRLVQVRSEQGTTAYTYDAIGNLQTVVYPNGVQTRYRYDGLNRLVELTHQNSSGAVLASYAYTLSPTGQRTQVVEASGQRVNDRYDALGRLVEEKVNSPTAGEKVWRYQYDAVGNRLQKEEDGETVTYRYDENDRLIETAGTVYDYDAEGNLVQMNQGTAQRTYRYDAQQRLVEGVTEMGQQVRYEYDAEGYRVSKEVGDEVTTSVMDDQGLPQVIAELDEQGKVKVSYEYGDRLLSQEREGKVFYYHADGLGSTRLLTDEAERKTDSYDYEAFGELLKSEGGSPNEYLFAGERYEAQLGLYDLRARFYEPGVGRFTQRDSFEGWERRPVTLHRYLYANGDPVNYVDPTGQMAIALWTGTRWVGTIVTGLAIVVGIYGISWTGEHFDPRKELYLDTTGINFPQPCFFSINHNNKGCWDANKVSTMLEDTMEKDFENYAIDLYWRKGHPLQRHIEFGGYEEDAYGYSFWLKGWVYTKKIVGDAIKFNKSNKNFIDSSQLGIVIGNTGSHEAGHMLGAPGYFTYHEPCDPLYIMSTGEECTAVWPLRNDLDWSPQSKNWLASRFSKQ